MVSRRNRRQQLEKVGRAHGTGWIVTPVSSRRPRSRRSSLRLVVAGMVFTVLAQGGALVVAEELGAVEPAGGVTASASIAGAGHHHLSAPAEIQPDANAEPPPYFDPVAPKPLPGTVHNLDVTVEEKDMTVVPGVVQRVWTLNGSVPAPTIRVHVGDTMNVHFTNPASSSMSHSLDFHASENALNDEMRTIPPGESIDQQWKANYAGVWMYHCVTSPPVWHVASGMYGVVIVEPKEGLPPVDKEWVVTQNEWYLGPQHEGISLEKASASAPAPDYMAFNGTPNQYIDHPFKMKAGERGRIFLLNAGPNLESSFHIVGMVFDTVIKEGVTLTPDNPGHYGSQAVDLAPAQGAIVEFTAPEDGTYEFVTHTFNFHDRGAHGVIQVGDGQPKP